ncbi:MAG: EF-P 5-aminopentanol modification-associated protein YfmF [Ignavibacteriales bacterium]
MKYRKYETPAYNIHLIKTDKFKTITVKINFKKLFDKEDITFRNILVNVLLESSCNYPTRRLLEIATEELYNLGYSSGTFSSGEYAIMSYNCSFLHEKYTEKGMNEKSLQFFFDLLLKPNVVGGKFEKESFKKAYNILKDDINSFEENNTQYTNARMYEVMGKKEKISYRGVGYIEDLEKINEENLYRYYQNVLKSDLIDIFVIGDIDEDKIKNIILHNFNIKTAKKPSKEHFYNHKRINSKIKKVKEKKDINQSYLCMGFKSDPLTLFERQYIANIYSYILGGGADSKLFKNVREKNSLCYSISASFSSIISTMTISAGINADKYNKATRIIREEVRKMERGEFTESDIEKAKVTYLASFKQLEDSPNSIINLYVTHQYLGYDLLEERKKSIERVTRQMIINFAKKVHLDTIFFLEGGNNNG